MDTDDYILRKSRGEKVKLIQLLPIWLKFPRIKYGVTEKQRRHISIEKQIDALDRKAEKYLHRYVNKRRRLMRKRSGVFLR